MKKGGGDEDTTAIHGFHLRIKEPFERGEIVGEFQSIFMTPMICCQILAKFYFQLDSSILFSPAAPVHSRSTHIVLFFVIIHKHIPRKKT